MAKHTPGPWGRDGLYVTVLHSDGVSRTVADCGKSPTISREEKSANADLIEAAPDLLAALEVMAADAKWQNTPHDILRTARAAIRKAKGGDK